MSEIMSSEFASALYSSLFETIIKKINSFLKLLDENSKIGVTIGIFDIFDNGSVDVNFIKKTLTFDKEYLLSRNKNISPNNVIGLMKKSKNKFVVNLFEDSQTGSSLNTNNNSHFKNAIEQIERAVPVFVKCVKAKNMSSNNFDKELVVKQIEKNRFIVLNDTPKLKPENKVNNLVLEKLVKNYIIFTAYFGVL